MKHKKTKEFRDKIGQIKHSYAGIYKTQYTLVEKVLEKKLKKKPGF